jgi:type 1 glutamine amidotransferase
MIPLRSLVTTFAVLAAAMAVAGEPLEVLYVTGGCCHDYDGQKKVIAEGMARRARVQVTVVHEGGTERTHKVSIYDKPEWARGYDVVFHNECFGGVTDLGFVKNIIAEHRRGVPAVMMHCAMHSYRTGTDDWYALCGIQSPAHDEHYEYAASLLADHPILAGLPREWRLPREELYYCDKLFPSATPLAEAMSRTRKSSQTVVWTNDFHGTRVFGTTIGHFTETVQTPEFLDLVTRGTLWAAGKLESDGTPVADLDVAAGPATEKK